MRRTLLTLLWCLMLPGAGANAQSLGGALCLEPSAACGAKTVKG